MADIVNDLLLQDGQILMTRRSPLRRTYPNIWSFPGGHVEEGAVLFHLFAVEAWDGEPENLGHEHSELRWMDLKSASRLPDLALNSYAGVFASLI